MLQKKICMLGGFAVGKTSLVRRFVQSIFSETYLTTVGVKIDKKSVVLSDKTVDLILWDLAGEDDIGSFRLSYVRGASGLVLVADGTRAATLAGGAHAARAGRGRIRRHAFRVAAQQIRSGPISGQFQTMKLTK